MAVCQGGEVRNVNARHQLIKQSMSIVDPCPASGFRYKHSEFKYKPQKKAEHAAKCRTADAHVHAKV